MSYDAAVCVRSVSASLTVISLPLPDSSVPSQGPERQVWKKKTSSDPFYKTDLNCFALKKKKKKVLSGSSCYLFIFENR